MNEEEIKDYLFKKFCEWHVGQTYSLDKDGKANYYKWDVERFGEGSLRTRIVD